MYANRVNILLFLRIKLHKLDKTVRQTLKEQDALKYITEKENAVNGAPEPLHNYLDVSLLYIFLVLTKYIAGAIIPKQIT